MGENGVFTGRSPRQAALKAANRSHMDISKRERGTKNMHVFTGQRVQVDKPKGAPAWMPTRSGSSWSRKWVSRGWKRFEASLFSAFAAKKI